MSKLKNIDFIGMRKKFLILSAVLILAGLILNFFLGTEMDVTFVGGTRLYYEYTGSVDLNKAEEVVQDVLGSGATVTLDTVNNTKVITVAQAQALHVNSELRYSYSGELVLADVQKVVDDTLGEGLTAELTTLASVPQIVVKQQNEATAEQQETLRAALASKFTTSNIMQASETIMGEQSKLLEALKIALPDNAITGAGSNSLQPSLGRAFFIKCLVAVALAGLFLLIYVGFRFRKIGGLSAGVMGILALVHDLFFVYFAFVVFRIPLDDNFVAVMLAILGYSLNDTIVIYDRIRENRRKMKGASVDEVVNKSLNQSLTRTFNVALAVFLAVLTITIVGVVWQLDSIISFAIPMLFGTISGFYTSVFLSAPVWAMWIKRKEAKNPTKSARL